MKERKSKTRPGEGKMVPVKTHKKGRQVGKVVSNAPSALEKRRFDALIEHSIEAIALLDEQGNLLYDSPAASGLLGLDPDEWIGKSVFDLIHMDDKASVQEVLGELLKAPGKPFKSLFRLRRKDGSWLWIEAVATNRLTDKAVNAIVVNYRDITEQKQAQAQIEHQAHLLRHINDAVIAVDDKLDITAWNRAAESLYGWKAEEVIGQLSTEIMRSEMTAEKREWIIKELRESGSYRCELVQYRKDGQPVHVETNSIALLDERGKPAGILSVNRDITERRRAEEALRASEDFRRLIIETEPECVKLVAPNGALMEMNAAGLAMIEADSLEQVKGALIVNIVAPEYRDAFADLHKRVMTGQSGTLEFEIVGLKGARRWLETHAVPLRNESERITALLGVTRDITKRRQTEEALRASEDFRRLIFDTEPECVKLVAPNGELIEMNTAGLAMIEAESLEQVKGALMINIVAPEYRDAFADLHKRVMTGETGTLEFEIVGLKGTRRWLETHAVPLRNESERIDALLGVTRDITDRKQAEAALRESNERFRELWENTVEGIAIHDKGVFVEVNPAICRMFGYTPGQVIGRSMFDFIGADASHIVRQKLESGSEEPYEVPAQRSDGTPFRVELIAKNINYRGKPVRMVAVRDITARKEAEDALRRSEERYRVLTEASHDMITLVNRQFEVEYTNTFAAGQLGLAPHQLVGRRVIDFFPGEIGTRQQGHLQAVLESAQPAYIEAPVVFGERVAWLGSWLVPITDGANEVSSVLVVSRDITERKQAEEALKRSEQDYRHLFDNANDVILIFQPEDEIILEANEAACHIYGFEHDELIGMSLKQLTRDVERGESQLDVLMSSGVYRDFESVHLNRAGQEIHFLINSSVIEYRGRRAVLSLNRDITNYRQAEEALRVNEQRYRALFEETPISIWEEDFSRVKQYIDGLKAQGVTDLRSYFMSHHSAIKECVGLVDIVDINKAALQMYQAESRDEMIRNFTKIINADPTTSFLEELVSIAEGRTTYYWEGPDLTLTGQPIEVSLRWSVAPGHEGDYSKVIISIIDITERKRAEAKIQRQVRHLSALHEIDQAIGASVDLRVTLDVFLKHTVSQLKVDAAAILLFNPGMLTLEYAAWQGFTGSRQTQLRLDESYAGRAVLERNTVHIPNFLHAAPQAQARLVSEERFVDYYAVPLMAKGQVKGVLEIFHRSSIGLELDWLDFLETLSGQAAIAIENAQLFDDLQRSNTSLTLAYDATIEGWSRAMDLRDKETEGHTLRVTRLTLELARAMRVNDAEMVHIRRGALLHDIGKLGIPDHILLKMDELTDDEWTIMRKHPVYAYEMLSSVAYLVPALDIPYAHHEKWDGTGYPRGLKGQQIPLVARIFAVVDVWDAITSDRPYRPAWDKQKALEFIRSESGRHFDPQVVDAFLQMIDGPA